MLDISINNSSGSGGGGITCGGNTNPVLKNVLIMGNNVGSYNHGGGMEIGGSATLINVTITENTATGQPAGGIMFSGGSANIINSIILDNNFLVINPAPINNYRFTFFI